MSDVSVCGTVMLRVRKILNLRIFDDDDGKRWMKSVTDKQFEILCVSQVMLLFSGY